MAINPELTIKECFDFSNVYLKELKRIAANLNLLISLNGDVIKQATDTYVSICVKTRSEDIIRSALKNYNLCRGLYNMYLAKLYNTNDKEEK